MICKKKKKREKQKIHRKRISESKSNPSKLLTWLSLRVLTNQRIYHACIDNRSRVEASLIRILSPGRHSLRSQSKNFSRAVETFQDFRDALSRLSHSKLYERLIRVLEQRIRRNVRNVFEVHIASPSSIHHQLVTVTQDELDFSLPPSLFRSQLSFFLSTLCTSVICSNLNDDGALRITAFRLG